MGYVSSVRCSVIAHRYLGLELHVQWIIDAGMRLIDFKINSVTQNAITFPNYKKKKTEQQKYVRICWDDTLSIFSFCSFNVICFPSTALSDLQKISIKNIHAVCLKAWSNRGLKLCLLSGVLDDTASGIGQHSYRINLSYIACCCPMLMVSDLTYIVLKPSTLWQQLLFQLKHEPP